MFIGHDIISKVLEQYECRISKSYNDHCMTGFVSLPLATKPYTEHILYLVPSLDKLKNAELLPYMNLLIFNPKKENLTEYLAQDLPLNYTEIYTDEIQNVNTLLRDFFFNAWSRALMADTIVNLLFQGGSVQEMVDSFIRGFNNPIFVFDASFNLIAANYEMANEWEQTEKIIRNGCLTEEEFKLLNNPEMPYSIVKKRETPVRIHHKELGFEQLVCAIDTKKDMGHIVLCAVNRPLCQTDENLLIMLKKGIYQLMIQQDFIRNNSGFPYEYFLKDLLDKKIEDGMSARKRMTYINTSFLENIWCMVIETSRTPKTLNVSRVQNEFQNLLSGTKTLVYNDEIIVLFQKDADNRLPDDMKKKITEICESSGLYAGMSNSFTDILKLESYHKQAIRALELGTAERDVPGLYCYDHYYIHHILNSFSQKSESDTFCYPKLQKLLEYDRKNGTDLAYSLYMYLICERNSIVASNEMFIHRNTLIYRLKKIDSLVNIDYENYDERRYLILSYEMVTRSREQQRIIE